MDCNYCYLCQHCSIYYETQGRVFECDLDFSSKEEQTACDSFIPICSQCVEGTK